MYRNSDHYHGFIVDLRKGVFTIVSVTKLASFSVTHYVTTSHLHPFLLLVMKHQICPADVT